jgi:hypothetical protein
VGRRWSCRRRWWSRWFRTACSISLWSNRLSNYSWSRGSYCIQHLLLEVMMETHQFFQQSHQQVEVEVEYCGHLSWK